MSDLKGRGKNVPDNMIDDTVKECGMEKAERAPVKIKEPETIDVSNNDIT